MKKEPYNWWTDPANAEEVKQMSWWDHEENRYIFGLPLAVIEQEGHWTATFSSETESILGEELHACASGSSREEAIGSMFKLMRIAYNYNDECRLNYQRFVPFRKGPWKSTGGRWFTIFGINFSFRYGKKMQGGWYLPFTKLNISFYNEWIGYKKWKSKHRPS